jgi:hypothetical protein
LNNGTLDWHIWAVGAVAVALAGAALLSQLLRRRPNPDETERLRRAHLNQIGRIVDGHVVDLVELPPDGARLGSLSRQAKSNAAPPVNGHRKLVCYSYSISGVSYETSQDITSLEGQRGLERIIAGQSASIKYDPSNPSDSILLADDWSGLR